MPGCTGRINQPRTTEMINDPFQVLGVTSSATEDEIPAFDGTGVE